MPLSEDRALHDTTLDRLQPQALLARGLEGLDSGLGDGAAGSAGSGSSSSFLGSSAMDVALGDLLVRLFPEYQFEGRLGSGGGGTVYRAQHRQLKRRVAVKLLSGSLTRSVAAVARFEREIEAVGKLDDPGIVRAFDGGQREGVWFLVMELVEGVDFGSLSRALGPLAVADACELVRQAALALQHAHERKLIHRDVKPGNLMLAAEPDGTPVVKVLDFGLAQLTRAEAPGGELTVSGELLGTVDYVAPEQIVNPRTVDERADIYGLGATLYRLLTGRPPHRAGDSESSLYARLVRISHEDCPSVSTCRAELSPDLVTVVDRLIAREPKHRFATAAEVVAALEPFVLGNSISTLLTRVPRPAAPTEERPVTPRSTARPKKSRPALVVGVVFASMAVLAWPVAHMLSLRKDTAAPLGKGTGGAVAGPALSCPRGITLGTDGAFYGGAMRGGEFNQGALYRFMPPSTVTVLVDFTGTNGAVRGRMPGRQLLLARDGFFYGVTERGGRHDLGTVFRFDPRATTNRLTTLWDFTGTDGSEPLAGLIEDNKHDGIFYGGTQMGGSGNSGTIFRFNCTEATPQLETLAELTGDGGAAPGRRLVSALAQTADGTLFGTTPEGGAANGGTAFRLTLDGHFTSLASFGQPPLDFYNPTGGITLGKDGNLYGLCYMERDGHGAAFRLTPAGDLRLLVRFGPPHGAEPASTLMCAPDGNLYGATLTGGTYRRGTLFRFTPAGELTTLASFPDVGGPSTGGPWALPTFGQDGNIYGTIEVGGADQNGLLYRVNSRGEVALLVEFPRRARPVK